MFKATLTGAALALLPLSLSAQYWATKEVCTVDEPFLDPALFTDPTLDELQSQAALIPNGLGRFWRITAPNGAVSHMWGTMHSNDPLLLDIPEPLKDALTTAKTVAVEIDPIYPSRRKYELQFRSDRLYRSPHFEKVFKVDPPEIEDWIRSRAHGLGWSRDTPDFLTLGAIAELLLSDPCADFAHGTYPIQDSYIQMLGAIAGAEIVGLEPPDRFLTKLDKRGNGELALAIIAFFGSFLDPNQDARGRSAYYAAYLQGQLGLMSAWDLAHVKQVFGDNRGPEIMGLVDGYLLVERNHDFVKTAIPVLDAGQAVIAVGAAHLPGENGMVALLRAAGFSLERVVIEGEAE